MQKNGEENGREAVPLFFQSSKPTVVDKVWIAQAEFGQILDKRKHRQSLNKFGQNELRRKRKHRKCSIREWRTKFGQILEFGRQNVG
jgi:hypothetical protein